MIYFIILFYILFLSYIYDLRGYKKQRKFWYNATLIILIILSGLRYRLGIDTSRYMNFFDSIPTLFSTQWSTFESRFDPLFLIFVSLAKTISSEFYVFQFIHAIFVNTVFFLFIKRYTKNIFMAVFFYFIQSYINFNFEVLRESMAVAFFLLSTPYLINKKWIRYYLFIIMAFLSHSSAFFLFIFPLFRNIKLNRKQIWLLIPTAFLLSAIIQQYMGDTLNYLSIFTSLEEKIQRYEDTRLMGQIFNLNGIIMTLLCLAIYPLFSFNIVKKYNIQSQQFFPYCIAYIFVGIFTIGITLFYRIQNYFVFYVLILYADSFVAIYKKKGGLKTKRSFAIACLIFLPFFYFRINSYLVSDNDSKIPVYYRYYPYNTILDEEKSSEREKLYKYY